MATVTSIQDSDIPTAPMTHRSCWIISMSMEVTLRPGEDEDIVLANTKRVLKRAWALLEDNA